MKYKLVAVDLDGTLLDDRKNIPDYNMVRIRKIINSGIKFVLCSGRMAGGLKIYSKIIGGQEPIVCLNGAVILDDSGSIMYSSAINKERLFQVIDILREEKDTYYHFYDENAIYTEQFTEYTKWFYDFNRKLGKEFRTEIRIIPDSKDFIEESGMHVNKLVVVDKDVDYLKRLRIRLKKIPDIEITKSEVNNIEIMNKGISKGYGVTLLSKYYSIPIDECICIGNDENDISMIKVSGVGVAVANAVDLVKKCANYITIRDNNHGAIGEIIDKFILN